MILVKEYKNTKEEPALSELFFFCIGSICEFAL